MPSGDFRSMAEVSCATLWLEQIVFPPLRGYISRRLKKENEEGTVGGGQRLRFCSLQLVRESSQERWSTVEKDCLGQGRGGFLPQDREKTQENQHVRYHFSKFPQQFHRPLTFQRTVHSFQYSGFFATFLLLVLSVFLVVCCLCVFVCFCFVLFVFVMF